MRISHLLMISLVPYFVGCGHAKIVTEANNVGQKEGVVSMWANWVKPKGDKFDMDFHIKNDSKEAIIIKFGDMNCYRGERTGTIKYTFFNTGERTIDIRPGQEKGANMVCKVGAPVKGDFKVTLAKVYENPSNDGRTTGKVLASDIVWQQSDSK